MQLYNSLSKTKETFVSNKENEVKMYVCGITPYDTTHLGHAFTYITFDVLQRYLTFKGYTVTYVQNVTDIDDDLLKKAKEVKRDWIELGEFWTQKFLNDLHKLNIIMPTYYVKATDNIETMHEIITNLIQKEMAYEKNGNVYFRVSRDQDYGNLSGYSVKEMIELSRERGADPDDPNKEDPLDFIMWQKSKDDEPSWDSHWGKGRPGWHIECSAMVYKYLGKNIDIHGGGADLIYPHHESEIAQSESFTEEKPFSKYWLHTSMVRFEGEKMSKSLGNLVMVEELLKTYSPNAIRYLLLSHHYRETWEYKAEEMEKAAEKMKIIESALSHNLEKGEMKNEGSIEFTDALDDDLNTPLALTIIDKFAQDTTSDASFANQKTLREMCLLLGFTF